MYLINITSYVHSNKHKTYKNKVVNYVKLQLQQLLKQTL